jgi:hypothetical protein
MAAIPGQIVRGKNVRSDLGYARYGQATWRWWCKRNDVVFVLLDSILGDEAQRCLPPSIQRWLAPEILVKQYGPATEIALVDADTMIRWDAPSPFDAAAGRLSAVEDAAVRWASQGLKAFQHLFPGVTLPWWQYFNTGLVVMSAREAKVMKNFVEFVTSRWADFYSVICAADVGTDQAVLNYFLRWVGEPVHFIPRPFNLQHCLNIGPGLTEFDTVLAASSADEIAEVLSLSWLFDFIDLAYVWHFTNVLASREIIMEQTWKMICHNYPGMTIE